MNQQPAISIVMPIFNAQETLKTAIESICAQSLGNYELILVDDGSTDESLARAKKYAAEDDRVQIVHQENSGICAARNCGLRRAKGCYVTFCDDDDALAPEALATAWAAIEQEKADVVRLGYRLLRGGKEMPHPAGEKCSFSRENKVGYGNFLRQTGPQFVWNCFYRRAVLEGLHFDESCRSGLEDFIFNAGVYCKAKTAVYLPLVGYIHYETVQSTSSCVSLSAVQNRIASLPAWVKAEYAAAVSCCDAPEFRSVWNARKAEFVTFLMHQLRDARAEKAVCRQAWGTLRRALQNFPHASLDFYGLTGQNKKQIAALFLYALHLQGLYALLPNREIQL